MTGRRAGLPEGLHIDISVEAAAWGDEDDLRALAERAVAAAFAAADLSASVPSELSLVFTDDAAIRALNAEWRDKDKPTNVLSFPGSDPDGETYGPLLGDIVLARETIEREAQEMAIDLSDHISHLIVHGLLHLFDYDHQDDDEAELMESLEKAILATIGIDDPYADRPFAADPG